jgi:4-hydroxythreonine-4-phosphate dehydrogenase
LRLDLPKIAENGVFYQTNPIRLSMRSHHAPDASNALTIGISCLFGDRTLVAMPTAQKVLAVTMGDPAGIGPDIVILAWMHRHREHIPPFFVIADPALINDRANLLADAGQVRVEVIEAPEQAQTLFSDALPVLPLRAPLGAVVAGEPASAHAAAVIASIEDAVNLVVAGRTAAIVTSPIAKYVLREAGFAHAGHTEFLAELAARHGRPGLTPVMMMASSRLRAVPITVHIPLKDVPSAITKDLIITTASITSAWLSRYFGVPTPRLAVCGLNPHAGENGSMGREEIDIIGPAVDALRAQGICASGPHPADTLFHDAARATYDAVLAMYHDQALIPFKTLSFDDGVNVTLGLPFIRTSPDHGTAFSLAGTGRASPASFIEALRLARFMADAEAKQLAAEPFAQ